MSFPLGFVLLAAGAGKTFVLTESIAITVFVLGVGVAIPYLGVLATGVAFLAMYLVYLPLVYWIARRRIGFAWTRVVKIQAAVLIVMAVVVAGLGHVSDMASAAVGIILAVIMGFYMLVRFAEMGEMSGPARRLAVLSREIVGRLRVGK
ncbi:MAG: hypothetical protein COB39_07475 [Marinosulfonomonas sp.]|nr:MAG: hypothetical protein COB39_07475 [Marinosulfonomonas sp.]